MMTKVFEKLVHRTKLESTFVDTRYKQSLTISPEPSWMRSVDLFVVRLQTSADPAQAFGNH